MRTLTSPAGTTPTGHQPRSLCLHTPPCPTATSADAEAARIVAAHPEQGWSLLCNGVLVFDDTGDLLPDGQVIIPRRSLTTTTSHTNHVTTGGRLSGAVTG